MRLTISLRTSAYEMRRVSVTSGSVAGEGHSKTVIQQEVDAVKIAVRRRRFREGRMRELRRW